MSPVDGRPDGKPDGRPGKLDDGQLLSQFASGPAGKPQQERSEAAFEELVQRHGRMVFGVCLRLLDDPHDAEDAFQATFLVLARGAGKLRKSDSVASWLYGVALRVGLNAKRHAARRREHERRVAEMADRMGRMTAGRSTEGGETWHSLRPVLDEELSRLPERLRMPVVLCYLEGRTTEEAAKELGWTHGALRGRLAKARNLLRRRLSRKGVVIGLCGGALLGPVISENASAAAVPSLCVARTVQAATVFAGGAVSPGELAGGLSSKATSLAEEAIKGMFWAKIRVAAGTVAVVVGASLFLGTALLAGQSSTGRKPAPVRLDRAESQRLSTAQEVVPNVEIPEPAEPAELTELTEPVEGDLPEAVLQSLLAFRPGAVIREVKRKTKGQRTVYEVDLEVEGKEVEVELGPDGTIRQTKEEIDVADVPQAVADAVARLYPQAAVKEAEKETRGDRTLFEVVLEIDGEEFDVELTAEGEVIKDKRPDEQENEQDADDGDDRTESTEGDDAKPTEGAGAEVF